MTGKADLVSIAYTFAYFLQSYSLIVADYEEGAGQTTSLTLGALV